MLITKLYSNGDRTNLASLSTEHFFPNSRPHILSLSCLSKEEEAPVDLLRAPLRQSDKADFDRTDDCCVAGFHLHGEVLFYCYRVQNEILRIRFYPDRHRTQLSIQPDPVEAQTLAPCTEATP